MKKLKHLAQGMLRQYLDRQTPGYAAALAFYLCLALFPFLIFLTAGAMLLRVPELLNGWISALILPEGVTELLQNYLAYLENMQDTSWLAASGLVLSLYALSRAARLVMLYMDLGGEESRGILRRFALSLLFALVMLVSVAALFALIVAGNLLIRLLPGELPSAMQTAIHVARFTASGALLLIMLLLFYRFGPSKRASGMLLLPGAASAMAASLVFSFFFGLYVENFARYSVLYGSIAAFLVLMAWLYAVALMLLLGYALNLEIHAMRD